MRHGPFSMADKGNDNILAGSCPCLLPLFQFYNNKIAPAIFIFSGYKKIDAFVCIGNIEFDQNAAIMRY